MLQLLLSSAYRVKGFGLLMLPSQHAGGTQGARRGHSQDSWLKLATGISRIIWAYILCSPIKLRRLALGLLPLRDWLAIGGLMVNNRIVQHFFCMFFYHYQLFSLDLLPSAWCPVLPSSGFSPPCYCREWANSWVVLNCLLSSTAIVI